MKSVVLKISFIVCTLMILGCSNLLPKPDNGDFDGKLDYTTSRKEVVQKIADQLNLPKDDINVSWSGSSSMTSKGMDYFINVTIENLNPEKLDDVTCKKMMEDSFSIINDDVTNFDRFKALKTFISREVEENGITKRKEYIIRKAI